MSASLPTWSVVATVEEPPALVMTFVAWHLHLGAETIYLYCDNPDDPVVDMLAHLPQVQVTVCDAEHWLRVGKSRPRRHQVRQARNACDAYARCTADWLIHIDADEYLWPNQTVAGLLGTNGPEADAVVTQVAERVHLPDDPGETVFEGAFRRPFRKPPKLGERIFGPDYALSNRGLYGHAHGKAFARTGRKLAMSIHRPQPVKGAPDLMVSRPAPEAIELLHLDGLTPAGWIYKLARMQRALIKQDGMPPSPHRRAQADALMAAPNGAEALYQRLKVAEGDLPKQLQKHGLWTAPTFDPRPALERYFPEARVDLSPAAMDAWLAANKPRVIPFLWQHQ